MQFEIAIRQRFVTVAAIKGSIGNRMTDEPARDKLQLGATG